MRSGQQRVPVHAVSATDARHDSVAAPDALARLQALARRVWTIGWPLVFLVPLAQVVAILWIIWFHTPNLPWYDEWATVSLVQHANQGALTFQDFWALHYERHRIAVPRALDLALIELTHWNRQIEMTVDLAIAVASALLIFACARKALRSRGAALALVIPISLLMFSLGQSENWFAPFQVAFITTIFGVAVALWAMTNEAVSWPRLLLTIGGALFATFSSAAGLMVWPALLPSMWRAGWRKLALWIACGVVTWTVYLIGVPSHPTPPDQLQAIEFILTYLGGPLGFPSVARAQLFGLAGIALLVGNLYLYWRGHHNLWGILVWVDLGLFGLAVAALTAAGRHDLGPATSAGAFVSHYQIYPALWWVSPIVLSALTIQSYARQLNLAEFVRMLRGAALARSKRIAWLVVGANVAALLVVCLGAALVNRAGFRDGLAWQDGLLANQACVVQEQIANDICLSRWMPVSNKAAILQDVTYLRQHHLALFYDDSAGGR